MLTFFFSLKEENERLRTASKQSADLKSANATLENQHLEVSMKLEQAKAALKEKDRLLKAAKTKAEELASARSGDDLQELREFYEGKLIALAKQHKVSVIMV